MCIRDRRRSDGEVRPVELEQDRGTEQAVRKVRPRHAVGRRNLTLTPDCGVKKFDRRVRVRVRVRIRGATRIPTLFQSTRRFKCQLVRVLPVSREERGSPRTRCSTDPVRQRTVALPPACLLSSVAPAWLNGSFDSAWAGQFAEFEWM